MKSPVSPVSLVPSALPGDFTADRVHEPLWRQLGADHCRVAVIDLPSLRPLAWRWMRDGGVSSGEGDAQPLEHILPGGDTLLDEWVGLCEDDPDGVITHMLSPRRWVYFWRIDERLGALVQMHFLAPRHSKHEFDTAGVRVVCEHWLAPDLATLRDAGMSRARAWDRVDRRQQQPATPQTRIAFFGLVGCALLGLWLLVFGAGLVAESASSQQREITRLAALADSTMHAHLGQAMAGNDYGVVQDVLTLHQSMGHFAAAGVTNRRGQVIAHAGFAPALPVGSLVPADVRAAAVATPLTVGTSTLGEVLVVGGPGAPAKVEGADRSALWRGIGFLITALAAAGAVMLWRQQAPGRKPA